MFDTILYRFQWLTAIFSKTNTKPALFLIKNRRFRKSEQKASRRLFTFCVPFAMLFGAFAFPQHLTAQTPIEDCSNGIDDDGDGLIDCYDSDCNCLADCATFYYQECNEDCYYIPPCDQVALGVDWRGTAETGTYSNLVAGDMDADGIPDVVACNVESTELYIIDGATGATKVTINTPSVLRGGTAPAIADLDKDGFGEIVIVPQNRIMVCYEHDGTLKWSSAVPVGYDYTYQYSVPSIADFDHNGSAEILVGNQVFNGQTGALIGGAGQGFSAGEHPARKPGGFSFNSTVAMDVLPDGFCTDCSGLEIVAGNQVFSVNETTGDVLLQTSAPAAYQDGYTAVVDFDKDGDMDAVVQGWKNNYNTTYVWDCQSGMVIREFQHLNNWFDGASRTNIADLDGDGELELSFVSFPWFYALDNNFQLMWKLSNDDVSSITVSSVFDFCGDGSADIVYRGRFKLQIIEGATGQIKWEDDCNSATHIENPLILDVDADGQTEVVILCEHPSGNGGTVVAYEATNTAAISSRKVWNQHAYFNTNINEDLSVPIRQQNPNVVGDSVRLNTFMNQYFNPTFPSPDGKLRLGTPICVGDSIQIEITVANFGATDLPMATPVAFYKGNPTNTTADFLGAYPLPFSVARNDSQSIFLTLPRIANDSIFVVINDNGSLPRPFVLNTDFPSTNIGECVFENNMAAFFYAYSPSLLDLGQDTLICHSASIDLNAVGQDYTDWLWENGDLVPQRSDLKNGTYSVTITDVCGLTQTASKTVAYDSSTVVQLGFDREICHGDGTTITVAGFDHYQWTPSSVMDCDTCFSVTAFPTQNAQITLEASLDNGCFSRDTLDLTVFPVYDEVLDTTVCYGLDVFWDGVSISTDDEHTFTYQTARGCDSTVTVRVAGTLLGTYQIQVDTAVCLGDDLPINGAILQAGQSEIFNLTAQTGCDSTVAVFVAPKDTFWTTEHQTVCFGENYSVFGQIQSTSGIYRQTFTAKNGCDSTHTVDLLVLPQIEASAEGTPTCFNEANGTLNLDISGGSAPFQLSWNPPVSSTTTATDLAAGDYEIAILDSEGCRDTTVQTVESFPAMQYVLDVDSVRCFGENNGEIAIKTDDPSLLVAFEEGSFGQTYTFNGLEPGLYDVALQDEFGCEDALEVEVFEPDPIVVQLVGEHQVNLGDSVRLEVLTNAAPNVTYVWSPPTGLSCDSCPEPYARPTSSMRYTLQVTDLNGCTAQEQFLLSVERIVDVFVPNVFSPNSTDDANSRLLPQFGHAVSEVKAFRVFDRWGNKLHEVTDRTPQDFDLHWDGQFQGKQMSGTYVWQLELVLADGQSETLWGDVSVVR